MAGNSELRIGSTYHVEHPLRGTCTGELLQVTRQTSHDDHGKAIGFEWLRFRLVTGRLKNLARTRRPYGPGDVAEVLRVQLQRLELLPTAPASQA